MKTKLFFTGLALLILTTLASAQPAGVNKNQQNPSGKCLTYMDADRNGICDNFENCKSIVTDGNRNGYIKCCVTPNQNGRAVRQGMGQGRGPGRRVSWSQRPGTIADANKNGICDFYESATQK